MKDKLNRGKKETQEKKKVRMKKEKNEAKSKEKHGLYIVREKENKKDD